MEGADVDLLLLSVREVRPKGGPLFAAMTSARVLSRQLLRHANLVVPRGRFVRGACFLGGARLPRGGVPGISRGCFQEVFLSRVRPPLLGPPPLGFPSRDICLTWPSSVAFAGGVEPVSRSFVVCKCIIAGCSVSGTISVISVIFDIAFPDVMASAPP
jgi:hypothetical protein